MAFKQFQSLPVLLSPGSDSQSVAQSHGESCAQTATRTQTSAVTQADAPRALPWLQASLSAGEQALFLVLGLSAMVCLGQAFATATHWAPDAPQFAAWIARLLA